ncbi:MAG: hypothetical protein JWO48_3443 [Bryobacterales bacterium]|nr:hypothetical protein [Bryobacterales bacterium]
MLYISVTLFPLLAIICGVVALFAVVRFIAQLNRDIRSQAHAEPSDGLSR